MLLANYRNNGRLRNPSCSNVVKVKQRFGASTPQSSFIRMYAATSRGENMAHRPCKHQCCSVSATWKNAHTAAHPVRLGGALCILPTHHRPLSPVAFISASLRIGSILAFTGYLLFFRFTSFGVVLFFVVGPDPFRPCAHYFRSRLVASQ